MYKGLILVFLCLAASVSAAPIDIGPYLQNVSADGAIVVFETEAHVPAEVIVETPAGERHFPSVAGRHHEVRITGLPSGRYRYHVDAAGTSSPAAELATGATGREFTFLVYGDNRDGHANHARIVSAMISQHPDFVINTGDLTSDGDIEGQWRHFFEIERDLLASVPLYPALGNHEVKHDPQAKHYHRFFALPGPPAIVDSERYYSFRYANALFIALDSNESSHREQAHWLLNTLDAARADPAIRHIFVYFHHPPFAVGSECGSAREQGLWVPLFERHQVTAVFVGHEHAYEHMERRGIRYFITGGGGAPVYSTRGNCPQYDQAALRMFRAEHHFLRVSVIGDLATLDAIGMNNLSFETVKLHEPAPPEPAAPLEVPYTETISRESGAMPLITSAPPIANSRRPESLIWLWAPLAIIAGAILLLILRYKK